MLELKAMWTPGMESLFKGADPQCVAEEILSIGDEPTNREIVEKARDENSAMHVLFEWNNDIAAEKWRETQAGHIMRHLKISYTESSREEDEPETKTIKPVRLFYGNPTEGSGFVSIMKVMSDADMYHQLLARAKSELNAFREKYKMLKELQPVFEAIEKAL